MPAPRLFRSSSTQSNASSSSVAAALPAKGKTTKKSFSGDTTPGSPGLLKEVLTASQQDPPHEQGTEMLMSRMGKLTISPHHCPCATDTDLGWEANVQNASTPLPGHQTVVTKVSMDTPEIVDMIQNGVNTFMETVPSLIKALDEVAKVHPFISGASPFL